MKQLCDSTKLMMTRFRDIVVGDVDESTVRSNYEGRVDEEDEGRKGGERLLG